MYFLRQHLILGFMQFYIILLGKYNARIMAQNKIKMFYEPVRSLSLINERLVKSQVIIIIV